MQAAALMNARREGLSMVGLSVRQGGRYEPNIVSVCGEVNLLEWSREVRKGEWGECGIGGNLRSERVRRGRNIRALQDPRIDTIRMGMKHHCNVGWFR